MGSAGVSGLPEADQGLRLLKQLEHSGLLQAPKGSASFSPDVIRFGFDELEFLRKNRWKNGQHLDISVLKPAKHP